MEGRDYFFVTKEKFEQWIADGMLLEHAMVYGDYKGIPRQQVHEALKAGTDVVLRIDVQGAAYIKQLMPEAISIFVAAETEACLVQRLTVRALHPVCDHKHGADTTANEYNLIPFMQAVRA
ncbi:guanylate kinase-like domain-containing protein, partial [Haematococcus lacustris]